MLDLLIRTMLVFPMLDLLKVKLVPGTGKRGKVIKTALHMFTSMKEALPYEKTLLQSVKDGDLTRNVPGKVKLSAPNMTKLTKR